MARLFARGVLPLFAVLTACTAPAQPPAATTKPGPVPPPVVTIRADPTPVRLPPTRPAASELWPVTRLHNVDCVNVRDLAKRFDLKAAWTKPELAMALNDGRGVRCVFEASKRDFFFDGLRIFLGAPALAGKDSLWISLPDVIKLVAPLFRPADHLVQLPASPPNVIVLDPGHGGIDPGTENKRVGVNEKTAALDVAKRLGKLLEAKGWRVLFTRSEDRELSTGKKTDLAMRDEFATRNQADVFLSIHFNAAPDAITGIETYSMAPQFMLSTGDETGDEMTNVAYPSNRFDFANLLFGEQLHRAMVDTLKTPDRGYKRGRRAVLRMLNCPGALVECAYLSNDAEARRVAMPEFRQKIAEALAAGLQNYADEIAGLRAAANPSK